MKKLKALMAEFKAFITRGNVVDMAVAVIIGAAFGAIVTAMTNGIIKPLVDWAMSGMNDGAAGLITMLKPAYMSVVDVEGVEKTVIDMANSIYIDWGTLIMKIIDFLVIALVLFVIIKVFMGLKNASVNAKEKAKAKLVKKLQKQGMNEEEAKAQADAQVAEEEAEAPAPAAPTTEELLTEIRDLLAARKTDEE